jgi:cytochrome c
MKMRNSLHYSHQFFLKLVLSALAFLYSGQVFSQQADPIKGAAVFATHCAECHSLKEGKDKKGPSLFRILGAKSAQREGFVYSDAMRASQLTWNAETLANYISNPRKYLPGGKMKYDGLENAVDRANLLAFFSSQSAK